MKFEQGNEIPYMQDFAFYRGIPAGIDFEVREYAKGDCQLTAPGYGANPGTGDYGNGPLFVKKVHLPAEETMTTELKPPTREQVLKAMRDCPQARAALLAMYPEAMEPPAPKFVDKAALLDAISLLNRAQYWISRLVDLEPGRLGTSGAREWQNDVKEFASRPEIVGLAGKTP